MQSKAGCNKIVNCTARAHLWSALNARTRRLQRRDESVDDDGAALCWQSPPARSAHAVGPCVSPRRQLTIAPVFARTARLHEASHHPRPLGHLVRERPCSGDGRVGRCCPRAPRRHGRTLSCDRQRAERLVRLRCARPRLRNWSRQVGRRRSKREGAAGAFCPRSAVYRAGRPRAAGRWRRWQRNLLCCGRSARGGSQAWSESDRRNAEWAQPHGGALCRLLYCGTRTAFCCYDCEPLHPIQRAESGCRRWLLAPTSP